MAANLLQLPGVSARPGEKADRIQQATVQSNLQPYQIRSKYREYSQYLQCLKIPWVYACFPEGAPVRKADGALCEIQSLAPGDEVVTHTGATATVTEAIRLRYSGDLISVDRAAGPGIEATADHPFYVAKRHRRRRPSRPDGSWCAALPRPAARDIDYSWERAGALQAGDWLVEPVLTEIADVESYTVERKVNYSKMTPKWATRYWRDHAQVAITEETMRLIGYWLAEGWVNGRSVRFAFHENETDYAADVQELMRSAFGVEESRYPDQANGHSVVLCFNSSAAAAFFAQFGHGARHKFLPAWILRLPHPKQRQMIKGFWRGDGGSTPRQFYVDTASQQLADGLRQVLLRLGSVPSVHPTAALQTNYGQRYALYRLSCGGSNARALAEIVGEPTEASGRASAFIANGYAHYKIRSLSAREVLDLPVYNLEVEGDHSYLAHGVATHNCVSLLAYSVASSKYGLVDQDQDPIDQPQSPLLQLLAAPNPVMSGFQFRELADTYLELTGNLYISLEERDGYGRPRELYLPNPANMRVVPDPENFIAGYLYDPTGGSGASGGVGQMIPYDADEIIHIKLPNPLDPYYGLGQIEAMSTILDVVNSMAQTELAYWQSGGRIIGVLQTDMELTQEDFRRLREDWSMANRDDRNRARIAVLTKGLKYTPIAEGLKSLDLVNLDKSKRDTILAGFGVPLPKLGILENAQYKQEDADRTFQQETMAPKFLRLEDGLQPLVDLYDPDQALMWERRDFENDTDKLQNGLLMLQAGYTLNEVLIYTGGDPIGPDGDIILMSNLVTPVPVSGLGDYAEQKTAPPPEPAPPAESGTANPPPTPGADPPKTAVPGSTGGSPILKLADFKGVLTPEEQERIRQDAFAAQVRTAAVSRLAGRKGISKPMDRVLDYRAARRSPGAKAKPSSLIGAAVERDRAQYITGSQNRNRHAIHAALVQLLKPLSGPATAAQLAGEPDATKRRAMIAKLLDPTIVQSALAKIHEAAYQAGHQVGERLITVRGGKAIGAIGGVTLGSQVEAQFPKVGSKIVQSWQDITDTQIDRINSVVSSGIEAGSTDAEIGGLVQQAASQITDARADMIARTETMQAYNAGNLMSYADAGVTQMDVMDGDADPLCAGRDGQTVDQDTADDWLATEHPSGTISFIPNLDSIMASGGGSSQPDQQAGETSEDESAD